MLNVELNQGHVFHSTFNIAFRPSASLPPSPLNRCVPFCASVFHRLLSTVAYRSAFFLLPSPFGLLPSPFCPLPPPLPAYPHLYNPPPPPSPLLPPPPF